MFLAGDKAIKGNQEEWVESETAKKNGNKILALTMFLNVARKEASLFSMNGILIWPRSFESYGVFR